MKIKIKDLEKQLPYKIKRNYQVISFDTAQVSGISILKTDKEYLTIENLVLSFKTKNHKEIYETMVNTFAKLIDGKEDLAIIETVFVGFNRAGSVELAKYGAFAISECIKKNINYELISAVSSRANFKIDVRSEGKGNAKKAVSKWLNNLGIKITDHNTSDSVILGLNGICEGITFK